VDVPQVWRHGKGIFGGFTAALALATAANEVNMATIAGVQVMFARAVEPGPLDVAVEQIRRGGSSAAVHVRLRQDTVDRVLVQAWLVDGPIDVGEREAMAVAGPASCPEVTCWDELMPFMKVIDKRAIDYPLTIETFLGGPPLADLWVRAGGDAVSESLAGQLVDVIALDTYLGDAAYRPHQTADFVPSSLDLNVWWSSTATTEWRRVRVEAAGPGRRLTPTIGTVWSPDGAVRARASQLVRFSTRSPATVALKE
jgi:acyl-CoA thioesterase